MPSNQLKDFQSSAVRPAFIPYNLDQMEQTAAGTAAHTLIKTNAVRAMLNPDWDRALKLGATSIEGDAGGDTTLMPAMQAEAIRSGLGSSLGAFGDTASTLTPDSAGTAKVSQNLFGSVNALGQQVRANRNSALQLGNQIFPDTQMGLSGQDAALITGANTLGENSWNEANYKDQLENDRLNWRVQAENQRTNIETQNANAAASAQSGAANKQAMIQGGAAIAGVAVLAIAL